MKGEQIAPVIHDGDIHGDANLHRLLFSPLQQNLGVHERQADIVPRWHRAPQQLAISCQHTIAGMLEG